MSGLTMSATAATSELTYAKSEYDAVILGAGVLGLSIAHELTDRGYKVVVVAKDLPEDLESTGFASPWAGANWSPFASNDVERRRDLRTYARFAKLAQDHPELCERRTFRNYWDEPEQAEVDWFNLEVIGYRNLEPAEVPSAFKYGNEYQSYTLNTPRYLPHLASTLRSKGVAIVRARLSALDEAYSLTIPGVGHDRDQQVTVKVDLVVNAIGLGARWLIGVEDSLVYPAKGQTILVRAPGVNINHGVKTPHLIPGQKRYVIPRPNGPNGQENHVILGGCSLPNDWSTGPDPIVAEQILKDAHDLVPQLDGKGGEGSWEDIDVIAHNVGLRPARVGGMRLELEERRIGDRPTAMAREGEGQNGTNSKETAVRAARLAPTKARGDVGRQVAVVHAYGIGPAGYQASLGVAEEVAGLVDKWAEGRKAKIQA